MCLGDGSGGYSWALLESHPKAFVFYNSLVSDVCSIQQAPPIPYIPALAGRPDLESRIIHFTLTNDGISDLTHPDFPQYISSKITQRIRGILCDAETRKYEDATFVIPLTRTLCKLSSHYSPQWVLIKSYAYSPSVLRAQISLLLATFRSVEVIRTDFSSSGNTEVFLACRNPDQQVPIVTHGKTMKGRVLPEHHLQSLEELRLVLLQGASYSSEDTLIKYTSILNQGNWESLDKQILTTIPLIAEQTDIYYPHSVLTWMRLSGQLSPGHPKIIITHLETKFLSLNIIKHWAICWLLLGLWGRVIQPEDLYSIIRAGVIVWYPLRDNTWEISLTTSIPPLEIQGKDILVWDLENLITTKELKIIHKTSCVLWTYRSSPILRSKVIERGPLNLHGHMVTGDKLPKSDWVQQNIFTVEQRPLDAIPPTSKETVKQLWEQRLIRRRKLH